MNTVIAVDGKDYIIDITKGVKAIHPNPPRAGIPTIACTISVEEISYSRQVAGRDYPGTKLVIKAAFWIPRDKLVDAGTMEYYISRIKFPKGDYWLDDAYVDFSEEQSSIACLFKRKKQ